MKRCLEKREDQAVSSDSLYKLAKVILKHNCFGLGQDVYHQIVRSTIATKFAVLYANIFMVAFEDELFINTEFQPLLRLFYLDYIFGLCADGIN